MKKKYLRTVLIALAAVAPLASNVMADPEGGPAYTSPADVDSDFYAAQEHAYSQDSTLMNAISNADQAQDHLLDMQATGSAGQIMKAEQILHNAESMASTMLSGNSGVNTGDIEVMHEGGLTWSQVGRELGLGSGFGMTGGLDQAAYGSGMATGSAGGQYGSQMGISSDEMQAATSRSSLSGWSEGHGYGLNTGVHSGSGGQMIGGAGGLSNGYGDGGMNDGVDMGGGGGMSSGSSSGGSGMGGGSGSSSGSSSGSAGGMGGGGGGMGGGGGGMGGGGGGMGGGGGGMR
ncbi:hypothetical protein [Desulfopila sp. IMCC35008]|uniref:hypothetical protein n=1 Tax=Desulfopila sp. IMCC35008 TaxID=2653858 RepID=UPI00197AF48A|nr:hypothetical protein [Desulfopila sp. IMCC35008]